MKRISILSGLAVLMMISLATVAVAQTPFDNAGAAAPGYTTGRSVYDSYHNLGVNGPNGNLKSAAVTAGGTTEVCVYCHSPHNATKPRILWNKADYQTAPWNAITVDFGTSPNGGAAPDTSDAGTPWSAVTVTRFSARCLVCHDGSTSVGQVNFAYTNTGGAASHIATPLPMTGSDQTAGKINNALFIVADPTKLTGAGARAVGGNHPFSFPYAAVGGANTYNGITSAAGNNFVAPATVLSKLDGEALKGDVGTYGIECGSCHDTHAQADPTKSSTFPTHLGQMVRVGMDSSSLCFSCHIR